MVAKELWLKLIDAIESENYEEYEKVVQFIQVAGTDKLPAQEFIRRTLMLLSDRLSHVFQDHEGRLCEVKYVPAEQMPEIKMHVSMALISEVERLSTQELLEALEEENVIAGLIKKAGLEQDYQDFIALMSKYPKRFNVFSLLSVYVRIGLKVHSERE